MIPLRGNALRYSTTSRRFVRATAKFRFLATVSPAFIPNQEPPRPPSPIKEIARPIDSATPWIDAQVLKALDVQPQTSLSDIVGHYIDQTGNVLDTSLPYEPKPPEERRVMFEDSVSCKEVITVAHCVKDGKRHKISFSSGFALNAPAPREGDTLIVTCGHTLEEVRRYLSLGWQRVTEHNAKH